MDRRAFLKSVVAAAGAPLLQSSGVFSAAEAIAKDLAAEAAALLQARHDAILDSALGESTFHLRMLGHWQDAQVAMTTMIDKVQDLQNRLAKLQEKVTELPDLQDKLETVMKDPKSEGLSLDDIESMIKSAENGEAPKTTDLEEGEVISASTVQQPSQAPKHPMLAL